MFNENRRTLYPMLTPTPCMEAFREELVKMAEKANQQCPFATFNIERNTKNRNATRRDHMYGPLNPNEPGDYWKRLAKKWKTSEKAAKKSTCGNCVAFDVSPRMKKCMPGEVSDNNAGELGYCWMHHFKCASLRSCDTWAVGGPINKDKVSMGWQKKSNAGASPKNGRN